MSAIITNKFRFLAADLFYDKIYNMNVANPEETDIKNLYFFIGRPKPWEAPYNDVNPTPPGPSINNEYQCHMDCLALKKLDVGENLTYAIPRYDWVAGSVYAMYDDQDLDLYNHPSENDFNIAAQYLALNPGDPWTPGSYYVLTDEWEVYMCLFNGHGPYGIDGQAAKSTVKPTGGPQSGSTRYIVGPLSDGYIWKYMYTLSQSEIDKYVTESWLPVKFLESNDGSDQWLVQNLVNNDGSIDIVKVDNPGQKVKWYGDGTTIGEPASFISSTANTVVLDPLLIPVVDENDMYTGSEVIAINTTTGELQPRTVIAYDDTTNTVTIDSNWDTNPGTLTHKIYIAPKVVITSNVTTPADEVYARAIIDPSTDKIYEINVVENGKGYKLADTTLYGKNTLYHGELKDVQARVVIPGSGGHGANPKLDLGGWYVMMSTRFKNQEGGTDFPTLNDYRRMGLMRDIYDFGTTDYCTAPTLRGCRVMDIDNVDLSSSSGFIPDEQINVMSGLDILASAVVIEYETKKDGSGQNVPDPSHPGKFLGTLKYYFDTTTGFVPFQVGQTITGSESGLEAGIESLTDPEYEPYSGQVLYIEQRRPIVRAPEQQEEIKIVLEF